MSDDAKILDAWPALEPSDGFADRVLDRLAAAPRPPRRRGWTLVAATVATVAAAVALVVWRAPSEGSVHADARRQVELGRRATAVLEPGAQASWQIGWSGDALVDQPEGTVFYRVERGGAFQVHTPAGDVVVHGTCFRVEVTTMKSGLLGAAIGSALTAAVLVTVFEGRVSLANDKGTVALKAGEAASSDGRRAPTAVETTSAAAAPTATSPSASDLAQLSRDELLARATDQRAELIKAQSQLQKARVDLEHAQAALDGKKGEKRREFSIDPSKEDLAELAKSCTLQWDSPGLGTQPRTLGPEQAKENGLSPTEAEAINRALVQLNEQSVKEMRALYAEITGDKAAGETMTPDALATEIEDKSPRLEVQRAFQRLAQERAGQLPPGTPPGTAPVERLMRLLTTLGDRWEKQVAQIIGPERAHDMRLRKNGWGSRSVSSNGCPKGESE